MILGSFNDFSGATELASSGADLGGTAIAVSVKRPIKDISCLT